MNLHRSSRYLLLTVVVIACGDDDTKPDPVTGVRPEGGSPMRECDEFDCSENQLCGELMDGGMGCLPECRMGYAWTDDECRLVPGMNCAEDDPMSLRSACDDDNRECVEVDGGAECGECLPDFIEDGVECIAPRSCSQLDCAGERRSCMAETASMHARCGDCVDSFTEQSGVCTSDCPACTDENKSCGPSGGCVGCLAGFVEDALGACVPYTACDDRACAENQRCVEDPTARCLAECDNQWIWVPEMDLCRPELICPDLTCQGEQTCEERNPGEDARCIGASCPEGEGRNQDGECEACSGWRNCTDMVGATGEVLATAQGCRCQPDEGYFINASGTPQRCDTDGDGWINDEAAGSIEGSDPRLAECTLRQITSVVLINDAGEQHMVDVAPALPLYEHPTNDGSSTADPHPTYGIAIAPYALNSFTKACVTEIADFNLNGVADVQEHPNAQVTVDNARVVGYFERYRPFAHFIELSEGWYSADGVYTIRERSRTTNSFPLRYPDSAADKWRTCARHVDSAYLTGGFATQVGRDFSGFSAQSGWSGMNHHSQFKCLRAVQSSSYDPAAPEQVYIVADRFQWQGAGAAAAEEPTERQRGWIRNMCVAIDSYRDSPNAAVPNARFQDFACAVSLDLSGLEGHVTWAVMDYVNGSQEGGVSASGPVYVHGCINECAEHDALPASRQCATNSSNPGHGCRADVNAFGTLVCGCRRNFGGPDCSVPCTDTELLTNIDAAQFPDVTSGSGSNSTDLRNGYWMCGGFSGSDNYVLSGGGYTLRGEISTTTVDGAVLTGGGYTLRAR